uniref:Uncharacterized protein n=1 Tax=Phakopsora pachyrhizi TaxID=170000 RepID=A0A0S1MJJ9_PHAPC
MRFLYMAAGTCCFQVIFCVVMPHSCLRNALMNCQLSNDPAWL